MKNYSILLANKDEEVVQTFYDYKKLFNGLISGKTMFFREYNPKLEYDSNKAFSENNGKKKNETLSSILCEHLRQYDYLTTHKNNPLKCDGCENRRNKPIHNLNHFSFYFNGMYFESMALETFFKIIDDEYDKVNNNSELISFLPRIIFYMKNSEKEKEYNEKEKGNNSFGFSEID